MKNKKQEFFDMFKKRTEIPAKEIRSLFGDRAYYDFMKQIEDINSYISQLNPDEKPLFEIKWDRDPITGCELKVIKRNPHMNISNSDHDVVFIGVQ